MLLLLLLLLNLCYMTISYICHQEFCVSNPKLDFDLGFNSHTQYKSYDLLKLSKEIRNFSNFESIKKERKNVYHLVY